MTDTSRQSVTIREVMPDEAAILSSLALRSKAHWGYSAEFIRSCEDELTFLPDQIASDNFDFVVAESRSAIIGFYAINNLSNDLFELYALFVEPPHIGSGVGRQLIDHAIQSVKNNGGQALQIQGDPHAEKFYLAAGAEFIGTRESGSVRGRFLPLFEIKIR